jgi:hypothetical protein
MQFTLDSIALIQSGQMTQMHRPVKLPQELKLMHGDLSRAFKDNTFEKVLSVPCEYLHIPCSTDVDGNPMRTVQRLYPPWQVGHSYAIQPGRGKFAVGRLRITSLRLQTLGEITDEDARAEGITYERIDINKQHPTWAYDETLLYAPTAAAAYLALWKSIYGHAERDEKCWAIGFEVCK